MKSMKITWIRRLFTSSNAPWVNLLLDETSMCLNKLSNFGPQYLSTLMRILNPFWQDVFECWKTMLTISQIQSIEDILKAPLWYNPLISDQPLYYPQNNQITIHHLFSKQLVYPLMLDIYVHYNFLL